jgi:hypothetical protein
LGRLKWFDSISYLVGGARWSSNDIEHGVLRGNSPSPASLFSLLGKPQWAGPTFKAGDPRAKLALKVGGLVRTLFAACGYCSLAIPASSAVTCCHAHEGPMWALFGQLCATVLSRSYPAAHLLCTVHR